MPDTAKKPAVPPPVQTEAAGSAGGTAASVVCFGRNVGGCARMF